MSMYSSIMYFYSPIMVLYSLIMYFYSPIMSMYSPIIVWYSPIMVWYSPIMLFYSPIMAFYSVQSCHFLPSIKFSFFASESWTAHARVGSYQPMLSFYRPILYRSTSHHSHRCERLANDPCQFHTTDKDMWMDVGGRGWTWVCYFKRNFI